MNRIGFETSEVVLEHEQSLDQNIQNAQFKNLRLKFESTLKNQFDSELIDTIDKTDLNRITLNEQICFLIDFFNQIDLSSQTSSNYALLINKIKTFTTYLDFVNTDQNDANFDYLKNQLIEYDVYKFKFHLFIHFSLRFLITKLDFLFNRLKISKSNDSTNNLVSIITLILKLLRKYFHPEKIILHYKKLISYLKITSNLTIDGNNSSF